MQHHILFVALLCALLFVWGSEGQGSNAYIVKARNTYTIDGNESDWASITTSHLVQDLYGNTVRTILLLSSRFISLVSSSHHSEPCCASPPFSLLPTLTYPSSTPHPPLTHPSPSLLYSFSLFYLFAPIDLFIGGHIQNVL